MRRSVLLIMVVALSMLVFAPVAVAQEDNPSADDRGADNRAVDDRGLDDNGGGARTFDDNPGADDVMASPTASASAASGSGSTASATATATATATSATGMDDASASVEALPDTGGASPVALVSAAALVLLVGSGLVATTLVRQSR
jgi:hypothetical protein